MQRRGDGRKHASLFTAAADGSDVELIASSADADFGEIHYYDPAWSPDGSAIAAVGIGGGGHGLTVLEIPSGSRRMLAIEAWEFAWSPDAAWLAYSTGDTIGIVRRDGTDHRVLASRSSGRFRGDFSDPVWSPDGRRVAFINADVGEEEGQGDVYLVNVDGAGLKRLTRTRGVEGALDWSSR